MRKKNSSPDTSDAIDERLLSAAVEVFLEKGFAAATVDEIAARAKASKLTFYNRYGNKEKLFEAVMLRSNAAFLDTLSAVIPSKMPLEKFLGLIADQIYSAFSTDDTVALVRVLHAEAQRFPQLASVFENAGPARMAKLVAAEFEKYMEHGVLRKADPALAAEHFFHLVLGELIRRNLLGLRPQLSKAKTSRRIAEGIAAFLRAYKRTRGE